MHPAAHRGLRELFGSARHLRDHWRTLAERLDAGAPDHAPLLRDGSDLARTLIGELADVAAARGLHGRPMAQGLGARLAGARSTLLDTGLEVNQALRLALLDAVHVVTLLDYLATVAAREPDAELARFLEAWASRMRDQENAVRSAAVALGDEPDRAVRAATPGRAGQVGHGVAKAVGTFGERFDRRAGR